MQSLNFTAIQLALFPYHAQAFSRESEKLRGKQEKKEIRKFLTISILHGPHPLPNGPKALSCRVNIRNQAPLPQNPIKHAQITKHRVSSPTDLNLQLQRPLLRLTLLPKALPIREVDGVGVTLRADDEEILVLDPDARGGWEDRSVDVDAGDEAFVGHERRCCCGAAKRMAEDGDVFDIQTRGQGVNHISGFRERVQDEL